MNNAKRKHCLGAIFLRPVHLGDNTGGMFSRGNDAPAAVMRTRPALQTDIGQCDHFWQRPSV